MQNSSNFQVYNASAGSGKTFTLVKEYLKVILNSDDRYTFQSILAITFTNKAAAEMKERILDSLHLFAEGNEDDLLKVLIEETSLEKETIQNRSRQALGAILQNYSAFSITTIDSFTHKIIKSFAFDLGLNLNFEVELDSDILLAQAVDVLISKIGVENDITQTLIDYSLDKAKEDKSWDISLDLNDFAKILLNDEDAKHFKKLSSKTINDFTFLRTKLIKHQKLIEDRFVELGEKALSLINNNGLEFTEFSYSGEFPKHFSKLKNYKNLKLEDLKFSGRLDKTIEEKKNLYAGKTSQESKDVIDAIKDELIHFYYESKELFEKVNSDYQLNQLVLKSIVPLAVLTKINSELSTIKEENNIRLISEFNQLISNNIKEEPAPFIYERIGQKFMHYFIDEMQDTSVLQWQNLIPLIDNALSQENSNLLLVGDGKQAIYRWRGGRAEQFIKLGSENQNEITANPFQTHKEIKGLDTNYRSYSEVIAFNNSFFQYVSNSFQNPMYQKLFIEGNTQKATKKVGGFVSLEFLEKETDKEENELKYAKKVLETISNLDSGFSRKEVCVLVRKKKEGVAIANYLSENGVDIVSSETLLIQNSKKVNFIIDVLQVIQHPKDHSAWVQLIYFLYSHLKIELDKHSFITFFDIKNKNDFFEKVKEFGIDFNLENFNQIPFYEKVEEIIRAFRLTEISDAYLQFFLDIVFEQQQKGTDVQQFLDFWESKKEKLSIVAPEAENAVQIMTIHKSKGLEFPVVIFPYNIDIYHQINPESWITDLPNEQFDGFSELLVSANKSIKYTGKSGENIYNFQREELELDSFNLLYVALTRSVEQLYVITEKTISTKGEANANYTSGVLINYLNTIGEWSDDKVNYTFGDRKKVSKNGVEKSKTTIQNQFVSNSWQQHSIYMVANSSKLWETEQGKAIEYGNLIHQMFSEIITDRDVEKVVNQYVNQGLISLNSFNKIKGLIDEVVKHPILKEYYKENVVVYNEREITTEDNNVVIPDRLVFNSVKEVVIIDYKTGKSSKRYHQQLLQYEKVLKSMGFKVLRKLLIYINDKIRIEEI